jgi:predicted AlkP superfamily pyrophosphatase or phosphodiesterase
VPSASRTPDVAGAAAGSADRDAALSVLLDPSLAKIVDLVAWRDGDVLHVANSDGAASYRSDPDRLGTGGQWLLEHGRNPVADQDPFHGVPLADPSPPNERNSYPLAAERLAGVFQDPDRSPDLVVMHTPSHHWPERGGHLGEHGSLDAAQSRAPLLISGAGVFQRGLLDQSARVIDIAPTLAHLCGVPMPAADGEPLLELVAAGSRYVVGLLWDGTNSTDLIDLATAGELPAVARLLEQGCALTGGAIADFPSVTLTNHTSALTGVGPARHGILHNTFWDRRAGRQIVANEASTWHTACDLLRPGVATLFEVLGGPTACVNEPVDRGAAYSTFGLVRDSGASNGAAGLRDALPDPHADRHASQHWVRQDPDYAWSTSVDAFGLDQVLQLWSDESDPPRLTWWNTTLTDTGHHGGGPYSPEARASLRDADRRLGVFLDEVARRGVLAETTFLLTADHGSEAASPTCRGDWDEALREAGVHFRDESYGFLYLGVDP